MRNNTLPLLSHPADITPSHPSDFPSIRLVTATPSASGLSSQASTSFNSSWASVPSVPSPLAPKTDASPSRKRLVPKKSKLGLLGGSKDKQKEKDRGKDLSDVVRRVGGSTSRRGFEIYVDPTDPEIGEVVVVKKKKSRGGLDGLRWGSGGGALEETTNIPSVPAPMTAVTKVKAEEKEKEKWWTLGRGRKDSKEKEKEKARDKSETRPQPPRSKTPEPFKAVPETQSRARFNSLDSGMLLTTAPAPSIPNTGYNSRNTSTPMLVPMTADLPNEERGTYSRSATPTFGGLLAPPSHLDGADPSQGHNQNSIALRAMRSVRSMARMGSWAQLRNGSGPGDDVPQIKEPEKKVKDDKKTKDKAKSKSKDKEKDETKKKSKKEKTEKKESKSGTQRIRNSTSSFEAGALTASPEVRASLGKKKRSILGLGLPSTMRLPTVRGGSTTSSIGIAAGSSVDNNNNNNNRLSVESAIVTAARLRSGSVMSTGSSLRPMSTTSSTSRASSGSSMASVKWDEQGLQTVKEQRRKEREVKRKSLEDAEADAKKKKANRESRRSSEGQRRTPISDIFPGVYTSPESPASVKSVGGAPMLTLEEATSDGHGRMDVDESPLTTPMKRARPRPLSEQLLGRKRPQGIHEEDGEGVISILSAATNDLAQLINHLDLEATPGATPGSPDPSPWTRPTPGHSPSDSPNDSPTKKTLRNTMSSISSLRPYAQSRGSTQALAPPASNAQDLLGQQIAPWPTLNAFFPQKDVPIKSATATPPAESKVRPSHRRTMSPSGFLPEASPSPVLRPLRPAKSRAMISSVNSKPLSPPPSMGLPPVKPLKSVDPARAPSSLTFGSRSSSRGGDSSISSMDDIRNALPNPVFRPAHGHARNRSSLLSSQPGGSQGSIPEEDFTTSRPLAPGAKKMLGMKGTMGGSDVSAYAVDELDASDPDSDIPDELQKIIHSGQSDRASVHSIDDTLSFRISDAPDVPREADSESSYEPASVELPSFHLIDVNDNHADLDDIDMEEDESDTKKSFDFTGELQKLNESGASDRASFVEQLENAFRTPAKIDLRMSDGLLQVEVPPVPPMPSMIMSDGSGSGSSTMDNLENSVSSQEAQYSGSSQTASSNALESFPISRLLDAKEPTLLPGSDSIDSNDAHDLADVYIPKILKPSSSSTSRPSDGELNQAFKFGGFSQRPSQELKPEKPITLSDIIPPPSRVRTMSNNSSVVDDSVINSIMARASDLPAARPRVNSDSSVKRRARDNSGSDLHRISYRHSKASSISSFDGFDSFEEVRRGFEFHDYRPSFYPPPVSSNTRRNYHGRQDSAFSIASISSFGHVVNNGVADPFDYGLPSLQERPSSEDMTSMSMSMSVDDTFSFLNHAPRPRRRVESDASSFYFSAPVPANTSRGHRRRESNMSVVSQGPPISMYNRSFGHRRNDSSTSVSSMAHSYAMHGAGGGRAAWARHRQDASIDSVDSGFSAMRLGRPGIGDKMFDTAGGAPLTAISASPSGSSYSEDRSSYSDNRASYADNRSSYSDNRSSYSDNRSSYSETRSSFDSIIDGDRRSSMEDSLFDKTGHRTSVSSDSVFGYDDDSSRYPNGQLLPPNAFRPVSSLSVSSIHSPLKEDDTMISMIGGGHVRRRSVGSVIEASPCVRVGHLGKRKDKDMDDSGHAVKARIVEKASIASTSSSTFGGERMIRARKGILERQSLEESALIADGEDLSISFHSLPVFSRPGPANRSRSSTCTSASSGGDTPPLSASDGSSTSDGSQSSIDLSHLNRILANTTHPISNIAMQRDRARARGQGHRRRVSQARASRSSVYSVYETIEEEMSSPADTPLNQSTSSKKSSPTAIQPVFIVDPDSSSIHSMDPWDDERGIMAMRRYYDLRNEAEYTLEESKRVWVDTPFSVYALQNFDPPRHPSGMQALLASSVESYGPLPSELHPRRRRTSSRPSPYPQGRSVRVSLSPEHSRPMTIITQPSPQAKSNSSPPPLQEVSVHPNLMQNSPAVNYPKSAKKMSSANKDSPENFVPKQRENARPRVPSNARRTALGWSKRAGKTSTDLKENNNSFGQGTGATPGSTLRLSRPRPRGRPTPARTVRV